MTFVITTRSKSHAETGGLVIHLTIAAVPLHLMLKIDTLIRLVKGGKN
jgi:hypothetical protein